MPASAQHPLKALQLLHKTMLLFQLAFVGIAIGLVATGYMQPLQKELDKIFQVVAVALAAIFYFIGTSQYKKKLLAIKESNETPSQKFQQFKAASILLWAMLEGPTLFCIICFILTGNYAFIGLAGVFLFLFFIFGVNRQKLTPLLGMYDQEIDEIK